MIYLPLSRWHDLFFFFFNDTATTEIYTLSLHDALPICHLYAASAGRSSHRVRGHGIHAAGASALDHEDRKSTRLNSSHANISYAVFCLKKKKKNSIPYIYCTYLFHTKHRDRTLLNVL